MICKAIQTNFGCYDPPGSVVKKLARLKLTKGGRPDRRTKLGNAVIRYERMIERAAAQKWVDNG